MEAESAVVIATKNYVKKELLNAEGGHDWFHIERVYENAMTIAKNEAANLEVVSLAALLHDIADYKFNNGNEEIGPQKAEEFLTSIKVQDVVVEKVIAIVKNIGFKGGNQQPDFESTELAIVQDADYLDAMGAIGIARAFNYGGFKNRKLYDPAIAPDLEMSKETYKKSTAPTINHFYEKLLLLKDKMQTKTGKKLAEKRHRFMENYLDQFFKEWEGKA
ncbi:HD domain-containing protein [Haloflavibacter putidus]|uniref:HD domain-containing protein n=1 Tax=Haloflavibacter putidus TaxID=2576776 RepID=A0A507ZS20_9FLAO|nr:HD domain-containing protein [Haloflavibacter putidus]TQD40596.1 HD domain-containing protein [Haloflavibacter putidus]